LVNKQFVYLQQGLQPDLLRQVLTSCTGLTQLTLITQKLNDQGLGVLLTHGTSITDLTLGRSSLTTSKADWACNWRKLVLHNPTLQELAYLPLKSVQQLQDLRHGGPAPFVELDLPSDTPAAQLPDLLRQATTNLASCPAWAKAPPTELRLYGGDFTSAQRVQLLQALAPVAGRHVSRLVLWIDTELGAAEAEAIAGSFAGGLTYLSLISSTLLDSFWRPLAERFPSLQELYLDFLIQANAMSVATYLVMFSCCASHVLDVSINCFREEEAARLQSCVDAWGRENIHLHVTPPPWEAL
jgi:hypothetical protein